MLHINEHANISANMEVTIVAILKYCIIVLHKSNVGYRYGNHYMGAFCYADDISLLSPTVSGLQDMLKICERYADKSKMPVKANYYVLIKYLY